jgi:hypothetical protein
MTDTAQLLEALQALVAACTPANSEPNERGEIRSVRTPEWQVVDAARAVIALATA